MQTLETLVHVDELSQQTNNFSLPEKLSMTTEHAF
jgi:hypothetical protein